jgi:hypothetical protein
MTKLKDEQLVKMKRRAKLLLEDFGDPYDKTKFTTRYLLSNAICELANIALDLIEHIEEEDDESTKQESNKR